VLHSTDSISRHRLPPYSSTISMTNTTFCSVLDGIGEQISVGEGVKVRSRLAGAHMGNSCIYAHTGARGGRGARVLLAECHCEPGELGPLFTTWTDHRCCWQPTSRHAIAARFDGPLFSLGCTLNGRAGPARRMTGPSPPPSRPGPAALSRPAAGEGTGAGPGQAGGTSWRISIFCPAPSCASCPYTLAGRGRCPGTRRPRRRRIELMAGDPRVSARPRPPSRLTRSAARGPGTHGLLSRPHGTDGLSTRRRHAAAAVPRPVRRRTPIFDPCAFCSHCRITRSDH